jgi:hypothetical protein
MRPANDAYSCQEVHARPNSGGCDDLSDNSIALAGRGRNSCSLQVGTPSADVIRALLNEDLTGRLGKDQTTEALEAMKLRAEGPILESMKELKDMIKNKVPALGK